MSAATAVERIIASIEKRIAKMSAFRATVTAVSGSLITIRREGAATADTEQYATTTRWLLAIGDVVLCIPLGGKPVIVDVIRRSTNSPLAGASSLYERSWRQYLVNPTATTVTNVGFPAAPTLTAVLTNGDDADGTMLIHTTGAVSGDDSGMRTTFDFVQRRWNPIFIMRVKTQASIANIRLWCGLTDANLNGSDTPTARYAAFRYATGTDGTAFWRCCTDANTGTPTVTTTTVAIAVNTSYLLRVEIDHVNTEARFYINDVLVATHVSNMPSASSALGLTLDVTTTTNATRAIGWGRVALGQA